jgi:hypothetical protein
MMAVAEVVKNVRAVTVLGVTKLDQLAQLASFKIRPT